jgi:hypothetical protein
VAHLTGVMAAHLRYKIRQPVELMLALKVRQPEHDIVAVCDGDPEALEQEHDEVGAARGRAVAARVVGGEREAHVDLEGREVEIVVEVLATQAHRCRRVLPELCSESFLFLLPVLRICSTFWYGSGSGSGS